MNQSGTSSIVTAEFKFIICYYCYVVLCCVMLCYVILLCYVMLCYVMLCYVVMLCYAMLCYVMLCYVMLCYVMLCYVMLCYVMNSYNLKYPNDTPFKYHLLNRRSGMQQVQIQKVHLSVHRYFCAECQTAWRSMAAVKFPVR